MSTVSSSTNASYAFLPFSQVAEEIVWYPQLERALGEAGTKAADHDRAEHLQSKKDLVELEKLKVTDAEYALLFAKIFKDLEHHLQEYVRYTYVVGWLIMHSMHCTDDIHLTSEETNDLPKFEAAISEEESQKLSSEFESTKKWMPTR